MAKTSTLFSNVSFIARDEEKLPVAQAALKENSLPDTQTSPGDAVIANILSFSKALTIERSRGAGLIEIVLN